MSGKCLITAGLQCLLFSTALTSGALAAPVSNDLSQEELHIQTQLKGAPESTLTLKKNGVPGHPVPVLTTEHLNVKGHLITDATRLPVAITGHVATQSVSVVDRQRIEQTNPPSLMDILGEVPGVTIARSGGIGGQIYMRGFSSNDFRIPMFIDGDRFRGRNTLQFMLIPPEDTEQVEVIRGAASSMYGSEAMSGLINIITRRAHGDRFARKFTFSGGDASFNYGSAAATTNGHLAIEGTGRGFDVRVSLNARRADDYMTPQGKAHNSDYRTLGGSVVAGYSPNTDHRIELSFRTESVTDGRAGGVGGAPGYPYTKMRENTLQVRSGRLGYSGDFFGVIRHIDANVYVNDFFTKLTNVNTANAARQVNVQNYVLGPTVVGGKIQGTIPWKTLKSVIGTDFFREFRPGSETQSFTTVYATGKTTEVARYQTVPDASQTDLGFYLNNTWKPFRTLTIAAAGRFDWLSTTSGTSPLASPSLLQAYERNSNTNYTAETGNIGLSWRPVKALELTTNVANSFRMPTTSEMFTSSVSGTGYVIPNPDLKPERGVTVDVGAKLFLSKGMIALTAFHSTYRNLVQSNPVMYLETYSTQYQNVGHAEINGIEAETTWQVTQAFSLRANLSALRATNTTTHKPLPYIAPVQGHVTADYFFPDHGVTLSANMQWAAAKNRINPVNEYRTGGYAVVNFYATADLDQLVSKRFRHTSLVFGIENMANSAWRTAGAYSNRAYPVSMTNGLLEPGRNVTVTVRHRF